MAKPMVAAYLMAAPLLASCAPAGTAEPGAAALTPKQVETLDKQLAGKVAGEPVKCLPSYRTTDTIRVSDNILLYRANGNLVYRNDLRSSCPGLARDSDIMVIRQYGTGTCSGDFFHLVDRSSGIRGPTCVFGEFVPYRKPGGAKAEPAGSVTGGVRFAPSSSGRTPACHQRSNPHFPHRARAKRPLAFRLLGGRPGFARCGKLSVHPAALILLARMTR